MGVKNVTDEPTNGQGVSRSRIQHICTGNSEDRDGMAHINICSQVFTQSTSVLNLLRGVFMFLIFVSPAKVIGNTETHFVFSKKSIKKVKTQINRWRGVRQGGAARKMTMNTSIVNTTMNTSMVNTTMNTATTVGKSEFQGTEAQTLLNKDKI